MEVTESELATALEGFYVQGRPLGVTGLADDALTVQVADAGEIAKVLFATLGRIAALRNPDSNLVNADIPDPEVAAIAAIVAAMDALDGETALLGTDVHERVIRWAMARYLGPVVDGG